MDNYNYLGTALTRPLKLNNGKMVIDSGLSIIHSSILDILNTPIGTRLFLPEYGSRLHEVLFEPNDSVLEALIRQFVKESLTLWERRVKFIDINYEFNNDFVSCEIVCKILASNEIESFIYPFYKKLKH